MKNLTAKANPISLHHNINLPYNPSYDINNPSNTNPNPTTCYNAFPNDTRYTGCTKEWEDKGCVCNENRAHALANADNKNELLEEFRECEREFYQCLGVSLL